MMNKNIKKLALFSLLTTGIFLPTTHAATKESCFLTADSQAGFGGLVITEYKCFDNDIEIPDSIKGVKIKEIGNSVFKDSVITSVKLPSGLKQISASAFADNIIEKVEIPEGVEIIEDEAFKNNKLTAVKFPKTLKSIGNEAFAENNLTKIAVPGRLNKVGDGAFCENGQSEVIGISQNFEWPFTKACFKQIKASTIENSYEGIETDFSKTIGDDEPVKTDSEEVNEITSALKELDELSDTNEELEENDDLMNIQELLDDESDDENLDDDENAENLDDDTEDIDEDTLDDEEFTGVDEGDSNEYQNEEVDGISSSNLNVGGLSFSLDDIPTDMFAIGNLSSLSGILSVIFNGISVLGLLFYIIGSLFAISQWELYKKAGKRGWAFLVPIYNTIVYADIAEMNKWLGIIPWLAAPIFLLLLSFVGIFIAGIVTLVIGLVSLILKIMWDFKVAKRFGWSTFPAILYVVFNPIAILFLGLMNNTYQPRRKEYKIEGNKTVENTQKIEISQPVLAQEQLNNVVEHFVGPEETSTIQEPIANEVAQEQNTLENTIDTLNVGETAQEEQETVSVVNQNENAEDNDTYGFDQSNNAFDAWKSMEVDKDEEENNPLTETESTVNQDSTLETSTISEVEENQELINNTVDKLVEAKNNSESTPAESELLEENQELGDSNEGTIEEVVEETQNSESESNNIEKNEIFHSSEVQQDLNTFEGENTEWVEEYANEKEAQSEFEDNTQSDTVTERTPNEDTIPEPEKSVESSLEPTAVQESEPVVESESGPEENVQYQDEPISDLDQLMANNNKNF